jgi:DNA-binding response OmpR family regulator
MSDKIKILLVEDDPQLGFVVQDGLEQHSFEGSDALHQWRIGL